MASLTRWTWVWATSRSWWWTGRPGMLRSMGSQRAGHDWTIKQLIFSFQSSSCVCWFFHNFLCLIWRLKVLIATPGVFSLHCGMWTFFFFFLVACRLFSWFTYDLGFPGGSDGKESACIVGDPGSVLGLGRSPGEGNGYPLQYSCLESPMDRGAWWATVYGVAKELNRTERLSLSLA